MLQKVPFVDLVAQHQPIQDEVNRAVMAVLTKANFILGSEVEQFEQEFAAYCGTPHAVGVDSGLSALKLALEAYGIGPGDEVIVPANTFIATAAAVTFTGAKVVLVDIRPNSYNLDPERVEAAITPRTKAIIPVHLYGTPAPMDEIMDIARRHNLIVIEDACQAHGAYYQDKRAGSLGHAAAFSFYPAKNLGAAGDGGILVTNDEQVAEKVRAMRNCGQKEKYHHITTPYNHRLDTLHAAVLSVKLRRLDGWNEARGERARLYNRLLVGSGVVTPEVPANTVPVWHLYVIRAANRDGLKDYLAERGISTALHYPIPIHTQPFYQNLGYREGDFPITEQYAKQILSLPMYAELPLEAVEYVADAIQHYVSERQVALPV
ncbi:MAG: DegT/DnrJ/EryC1/StrS family aminotransferase [Chloroflexi bacterium]|nr:DegT/DnrJ/EryC1/StrS family aminotransferase [Chloroflexota bacterium]